MLMPGVNHIVKYFPRFFLYHSLLKPFKSFEQSYGGFCAVTYLSFAPQGLKQVLLTGGIPPIGNGCDADKVYRACFEQIIKQNEKYYKRYPQDVEIVQRLVKYLAESEGGGVRDDAGDLLSLRTLVVKFVLTCLQLT